MLKKQILQVHLYIWKLNKISTIQCSAGNKILFLADVYNNLYNYKTQIIPFAQKVSTHLKKNM